MSKDLIKTSLKLVTDSMYRFGSDYTSNLRDLKSDADTIKSTLMSDVKSPLDTYKKIKSGSVFRDITSWFRQKSDETEDDDGEYDYGGDSSENENTDEPSVHTIDANSVRDITNEQTNAMYGIGAKQVEAGIANTAEIISSFKDRSAEIVASVNNVNNSIKDLTKHIDVLISISQNGINNKNVKANEDTGRITESGGNLSLTNIFEKARSGVGDNAIKSTLQMMFSMIKQGTPADALSMLGHQFFDNKKVGFLGGKTVNQIGTSFNDTVGSVTQAVLSELISSKPFKHLFGDMNSTVGNRDYSKMINNQYNTKPATFDGMTRYSIINVIPEYLKKINESISGESLNVDTHGRLTTKQVNKNRFDKVTKQSFADSGLSFETTDEIVYATRAIDVKISSVDIDSAGRALTMTYVLYLHKNGIRTLKPSQINSDDVSVINAAVKTLVNASGKPDTFWTPICMTIMQRLSTNINERASFVKNVNSRLNNMVDDAVEFATNSQYNYQSSTITTDMANREFKDDYKTRHDSDVKNVDTNIKPVVKEVKDTYQFTQMDYLRGIFGVLNRGINVHQTGKKRYSQYNLKSSNPNKISVSNDDKETKKDANGNDVEVSDGKNNFLSDMMDRLIPKGIRLNMQHFADDILSPLDKQIGFTDKNNTTGQESVMSKMKRMMSPVTDKAKQIGEIVGGVKVKDEDGKVHHQGGIIQGIGNKVKGELNHIGVDMRSALDDQEFKRLQRDVKKMKPSDDDTIQDQLKAQQVFAMMQTATADGDTTEDIGAINNIINAIKNNDLKNRLQNSISNMLRNNNSKDTGKKSMVGSILSKGLIGLKALFSPIHKVLRTILFSMKAVVTKVGNLMMKGIKSGLRDIKVGMSSMARGMFGQKARKDANGKEIESASDGVLGKLVRRPIDAMVKASKDLFTSIGKVTKDLYDNIGKRVKNGISKLSSKVGDAMSNIAAKIKLPKLKNPLSGDFSSNFMKGFSSVFKETQALKEKERLNSLKPATVADVKSTQIHEILIGKADSIFKSILDVGKSIRDKLIETKEEPDEPESDLDVGESIRDKLIETKEEPDKPEVAGASQSSINSNLSSSATNTAVSAVPSTGGEESGGEESPSPSATPRTGASPTAGATGGKKGKLGFDLGKIAGGFTSALLGIGKIILTVVASLEGFKALTTLIEDVFKTGLKPLNGAFQSVIKAIKPIVKIVTEIVTVISQAITQIVQTLVEVIQPILEAIQPILETIFEVLRPILDMITGLIEIILAPLMGIIQAVIVPVIRHIGNSLEILLGVVQVGMGVILTALGGILMGVGAVVKLFGGGRGILDSGKTMGSMGTGMVSSGIKSIGSGISKEVALVKEVVSGDIFKQDTKDTEETKKVTPTVTDSTSSGSSVMDGVVSTTTPTATTTTPVATTNSVTNTATTSTMDVYNSYGSGNSNTYNQHTYSSYNMSERGCGPVALADAYSRRSGKAIDPSVLAANMKMTGNYNPSKGTSVGGFINASKSMGMNTTVGGVTSNSLRRATPNNPVTVMGSGTEYGTRQGNNHYVNVVGTDKSGGSYVLNPMSGRVERRSTAGIVANAKLGMYGSGDSDNGSSNGYQFDESTTEAIDNLKNVTGSIFSMFTGKSENDKMEDAINAEKEKEATNQAKLTLGEDVYKTYEGKARELFKKENPKRDGESDKTYEARFQKNKDKYITRVSVDDVNTKNNELLTKGVLASSNTAKQKTDEAFNDTYVKGDKIQANSQFVQAPTASDAMLAGITSATSGPTGVFKSDGGVVLAMPDKPTITKTDMTIKTGIGYGNSPLHEFLSKMMGKPAYTEDGGFFGRRENQDVLGYGTSGDEHSGVDINAPDDSDGATKVVATVDGTVTNISTSGSMGNSVSWRDVSGNIHRVMHMAQKPFVNVGDVVKGGNTLLGYIGDTGDSFGDHLHYDIQKVDGVRGPNEMEHNGMIFTNPMNYWKYIPPTDNSTGNQAPVTITPVMAENSWWVDSYKNSPGMKNYIQVAARAGLSPAQTAVIAATGVTEDSAKKLTGQKSLTEVTQDYNGQHAVGIMNWIPKNEQNGQDTSFGSTLEEQLRYIRDQYFAADAPNSRALASDPYRSDYSWGDAYKQVTGRTNFVLKPGDRYGSYINKDIVEGMAQYTGTAVVPGGFVTPEGAANRLGTAAEAYNWIKEMGYAGGDVSPFSSSNDFDIPPISMDIKGNGNTSTAPVTINKYEMSVNEEKRMKRLKMILENTYNVRDEKVEELLEKILNKLGGDTKKSTIKSKASTSPQQKLFDDDSISHRAARLYIG